MELTVKVEDPQKVGTLFGPADRHLRMIRETLGVQVFARGGQIRLTGSAENVSRAASVLQELQRNCQAWFREQACRNTHSPMGAMSPVSSAKGTISEGSIRP